MEPAFWDSSSLIPLCVRQPSTGSALMQGGSYLKVVWWGSSVEMQGAFTRLERSGGLTPAFRVQAQIRLDRLHRTWREIRPNDELRDRAEIHVERFALTAADAFQLAAAWMWTSGSPRGRPFIAGDRQLLESAGQLGFNAIAT